MTTPARTIQIFGVYLAVLGAALVVLPNRLLPVFGMPLSTDVWVHVAGMLVGFIGAFYVLSARAGHTAFFAWTVPIRLSVSLFFGAFVMLGYAPAILLVFSSVDAVGALWTWQAIRSASSATKAHS